MLCLTRRSGEELIFRTSDGDVRLKVENPKGNVGRIRVSIDAPRHVRIIRAELLKKEGAKDGR